MFTVTTSVLGAIRIHRICTAVVVSLGILPYIKWSYRFCQGVSLSLMPFLVSSWHLEIRTGRSMAGGMALPRVITMELLHCRQTPFEPTRGSPRKWWHRARDRASRCNSIELRNFFLLPKTCPICFQEAGKQCFLCWSLTPAVSNGRPRSSNKSAAGAGGVDSASLGNPKGGCHKPRKRRRLLDMRVVPGAATAGGSSPRLCVDRACPGLMLPFHGWPLYWNTHSLCAVGFGKLHAQLEVTLGVRGLLGDALVMTRLLSNHCSRSVNVVDLRSWWTWRGCVGLDLAQRTDSYVYRSYSVWANLWLVAQDRLLESAVPLWSYHWAFYRT